MSKAYTDAELIFTSQIAYKNVNEVPCEVSDIVDAYNMDTSNIDNSYENWKVIDFINDNDDTGLCAVVMVDESGNAIISFRGTEPNSLGTLYADGIADVDLLDTTLTAQQEKAEKYMEYVHYKYGDQISTYTVEGHSLGGNLAQHATITAPADMQRKIDRCVSLDGPGFSDDYIKRYKKEIEVVKDKLVRYKWSVVSTLLYPLPDTHDIIISSDGGWLSRHSLGNVNLENGNFVPGDMDFCSDTVGFITRLLENDLSNKGIDILLDFIYIPFVSELHVLLQTVKIVKSWVHKAVEIKDKLEAFTQRLYYKYIAPSVSGDYLANYDGMISIGEEYNAYCASLSYMEERIGYIASHMVYTSVKGGYFKSKLFIQKVELGINIKQLTRLSKIPNTACQIYSKADSSAGAIFQV